MTRAMPGAPMLRWPPMRFRPHRPAWAALAAVLAIVALLFTFVQVVRGVVRQGEWRSQAMAGQREAAVRCNALAGARQQERCLTLLSALPLADSLRPGAAAVALAAAGPGGR